MREVMSEHRPAVVFHAAAYKHVMMMELNPVEAVRNNALATRLVARIAGETGVGAFVLVSTDKAVKPATVMGASKALAEWAVEAAAARHPATRFATVRFGNVLASSGSVVPIFRRQIAAGGPVTVTDPRMSRYFMTIPEAVQLIIRAGSLSEGSGEVFVLEMGDAVKIVDLARTMISLSGFEPDADIAIEIVGARPGEKFHEDLFNPYERPQPTPGRRSCAPTGRHWTRPGSRARSPRSTCWCSRATPPASPNMSPGWPGCAQCRPTGQAPGSPRRLRATPWGQFPSPSQSTTSSTRWARTPALLRSSAWPCSCCSISRRPGRRHRCVSRPTKPLSACSSSRLASANWPDSRRPPSPPRLRSRRPRLPYPAPCRWVRTPPARPPYPLWLPLPRRPLA